MIDPSSNGWLDEVVQLQTSTGRSRYLVHVRREPCCHCTTGTRTVSVWVTDRGRGEVVAWCGHCFNATCEFAPLEEEHRGRCEAVRAAVLEGRVSPPWHAARPALEDLEKRGLL